MNKWMDSDVVAKSGFGKYMDIEMSRCMHDMYVHIYILYIFVVGRYQD